MFHYIKSIVKREIKGYFSSPVAYVFIVIFLVMCGFFTFNVSNFYEARIADLRAFFIWHPWLFLFLIPSVAMRLWAEERRSGTLEILLTLPVTAGQAVVAKFLAAWIFVGIALTLTFPLVITAFYLGNPDGGAIITGYLGSFLLAGAYLSIGSLTSALTRNQVIAFILAVVFCLFLVLAGWPPVTSELSKIASPTVVDFVASLSFMPHFESMQRGVIDSRDIIYYLSVIVLMLFANTAVLNSRRA